MIPQQKLSETFFEYEIGLGNGPISVFIPLCNKLLFDKFITELTFITFRDLKCEVKFLKGRLI